MTSRVGSLPWRIGCRGAEAGAVIRGELRALGYEF